MMTTQRTQRRRSRLSAHLLIVAMVAAMLLAVLPFNSGARAEDTPIFNPNVSTDLRDAVDDPTGDPLPPVETPTPEPTIDVPDLVETVDVDDIVIDPEPERFYADVMINKINCPAEYAYNAITASIYDLAANCHDQSAVTFTLTDAYGTSSSQTTPGSGLNAVTFSQIPGGQISISEQIPTGFTSPRVFCKSSAYTGEETAEIEQGISNGTVYSELVAGYDFFYCDWFNIPAPSTGSVIINKIGCPVGYDAYAGSIYDLAANCHEQPVTTFHLFDLNGTQFDATTPGSGINSVTFNDVLKGSIAVTEDQMDGYGAPRVFCKNSSDLGGDTSEDEVLVDNFGINYELMADYDYVWCDWFNIPTENDGSITIYKHTCPAGYDVNAYGSNPWLDCDNLTNGVTFKLFQNGNFYSQSTTGDAYDGAVYWGGLEADDYQVQEEMPADTAYAFVFGCMSDSYDSLAPTDLISLEFDSAFLIDLQPGENLTCHWYNVPVRHGGTIVITKYWCDGAVYNSWACDLYEYGASFNLSNNWTSFDVTTGWDGTVAVDVDAGSYAIDELNGTWCHAESTKTDQYGNIVVNDDEITYVTIYNCGPRETPKTPKTPKFPNTGIDPNAAQMAA
ncbi:hypothetical protein BH09CHL1_BH09CHL1_08610 [soil metagenome]